MTQQIKLRPLEKEDLRFVHVLNNTDTIMRYWFEEPYEAYVELLELYEKHIHDQTERRFIIESQRDKVGLVELVEIDYIHRRAEFQIIIDPAYQGLGYAAQAATLAIDYAFCVLNLYKTYLVVDQNNQKAIHVYQKIGFEWEAEFKQEFFVNGAYCNAVRMCIFQPTYLSQRSINK